MADLSENPVWTGVRKIEPTDSVDATLETSPSNQSHKNQTDRTAYLKAIFDNINIDTGSTSEDWRTEIGAAPGGSDPDDTTSYNKAIELMRAGIVQGRLTLVTGDATPTTEIFNATTLYYTAHIGEWVSVYNTTETRWDAKQLPDIGGGVREISLALTGLAADTNYDIFIYDNGGTLTLETLAWSNSGAGTSARATSLAKLSGQWIKSTDNRRYLGTIRTTATVGECESSLRKRFVFNALNREQHNFFVSEPTTAWTYNSTTFRAANNNTGNSLLVAIGLDTFVSFTLAGISYDTSADGKLGIGKNSQTINSANVSWYRDSPLYGPAMSFFQKIVEPGYHEFYWLEAATRSGTANFHSNDPSNPDQSAGFFGVIEL